jgi:hypothetical protein
MNPKAARKRALRDKKAGKVPMTGVFANVMRSPLLPKRMKWSKP